MDRLVALQLNVLLAFISNFFNEGGCLPSLSVFPNRTTLLKDEYVLFQCTTSCSQSILWTKDSTYLASTQDEQLFIKTTEKSSGLYQCLCENHKSNVVDLKVKDIIIEATSQTVAEGDTVTFYCRTKTNSKYFYIYKGETLMSYGRDRMMTLQNVAKTHEGEYHCVFYQRGKHTSPKIHLRVLDFFQSVSLSPHPGPSVSDTAPLSLRCDSHLSTSLGHAEVLYTFYHGSRIQFRTHQPWYNISHAQYSVTQGEYYCVASVEERNLKKESNVVTIDIQALPLSGVALQTWPRDGRVPEGDELVLGCSVETSSLPVWFSWYRSRNKWSSFQSGALARQRSYGRTAQIVLPMMNETDSGSYHCAVCYEGEVEEPSPYANISVLVSIAGVNISISTSDRNTTLHCSAEGTSRYLAVSWLKDGAPLSIGPSLPAGYVAEREKLHIDTAWPGTRGTYQCRVHSEMSPGNSSCSSGVQVYAQPAAAHAALCAVALSLLALISVACFVFWKKHTQSRETSHSHVPPVIQEGNRRDSLGPTLHYNVQRDDIAVDVQYAAVNIMQKSRGRRDGGRADKASGNSAVIYSTVTHAKPSFDRPDPLYSNAKAAFH